jgi:hypothetical protein
MDELEQLAREDRATAKREIIQFVRACLIGLTCFLAFTLLCYMFGFTYFLPDFLQ